MGKTHEALIKAESEFQKKFVKNRGRRAVCKPGRPNSTYIVLTILGLLTVMIAGYVYGRINGKLTAADVNVLQNAQARIAQLDSALELTNRNFVALEKRLYESEKYVKEEQKARESQKEELLNNKAMVQTLQEKLKTAQSYQLNLQDEIGNSQREIKALRVQLAEIKKRLASTEAISRQTLAPEKRSEAALSFNNQKDFETDISDQQADDWGLKSLHKNSDLAFSAKPVSTADSDPLPAKEQPQDPEQKESPDPGQIIDWLLKKQAQ